MIYIVTAFSRFENFKTLDRYFKSFDFVTWIPILQKKQTSFFKRIFGFYRKFIILPNACGFYNPCYFKLNEFILNHYINPQDWYCFFNDDDWLPVDLLNYVEFRVKKSVVFCEMDRGYFDSTGHGTTRLGTDNITVFNVGLEQVFIKGLFLKDLKNKKYLFRDTDTADGILLNKISCEYEYETTDKAVLFNFFDKKRWQVKT